MAEKMSAKAPKSSGHAETIIKLGLVFFISLLSFAIGTLVGKEYSDRQYKLSQLEPSENHMIEKREVASAHDDIDKLTDEEIAKLKEEFETDDTVQLAKQGHSQAVPPIEGDLLTEKAEEFDEMNDAALAAAQAAIESRSGDSRKIATTEANKIQKSEHKVPTTLPKNAAQENVGKYTVQVGSYLKEAEAKGRATRLKNQGYNAFYIPGVVEGKTWYRVNIGTYATLEEAKRANEKFTADNSGQKGFVKEIH